MKGSSQPAPVAPIAATKDVRFDTRDTKVRKTEFGLVKTDVSVTTLMTDATLAHGFGQISAAKVRGDSGSELEGYVRVRPVRNKAYRSGGCLNALRSKMSWSRKYVIVKGPFLFIFQDKNAKKTAFPPLPLDLVDVQAVGKYCCEVAVNEKRLQATRDQGMNMLLSPEVCHKPQGPAAYEIGLSSAKERDFWEKQLHALKSLFEVATCLGDESYDKFAYQGSVTKSNELHNGQTVKDLREEVPEWMLGMAKELQSKSYQDKKGMTKEEKQAVGIDP